MKPTELRKTVRLIESSGNHDADLVNRLQTLEPVDGSDDINVPEDLASQLVQATEQAKATLRSQARDRIRTLLRTNGALDGAERVFNERIVIEDNLAVLRNQDGTTSVIDSESVLRNLPVGQIPSARAARDDALDTFDRRIASTQETLTKKQRHGSTADFVTGTRGLRQTLADLKAGRDQLLNERESSMAPPAAPPRKPTQAEAEKLAKMIAQRDRFRQRADANPADTQAATAFMRLRRDAKSYAVEIGASE